MDGAGLCLAFHFCSERAPYSPGGPVALITDEDVEAQEGHTAAQGHMAAQGHTAAQDHTAVQGCTAAQAHTAESQTPFPESHTIHRHTGTG